MFPFLPRTVVVCGGVQKPMLCRDRRSLSGTFENLNVQIYTFLLDFLFSSPVTLSNMSTAYDFLWLLDVDCVLFSFHSMKFGREKGT